MKNTAFGELIFNTGWKTKTTICLHERKFNIVVKAKAYYETDDITAEQEFSYIDFKNNIDTRLATVEKLLYKFTNGVNVDRFIPKILLFQRNGEYALLLDDIQDDEGGVAVCIAPKPEVIAQNEYL
ncbi:MAG: hypothetical protein EOL98_07925 [Negativicutes bacterium]|nr:hypothetical protein [Negativicutes bacterium]